MAAAPPAELPVSPPLPLLVRTLWTHARWPAALALGAGVAAGLVPAAQVRLSEALLALVPGLGASGPAGLGPAVGLASALIAVTLGAEVLSAAEGLVQSRCILALRLALDGGTLAAVSAAPYALFDQPAYHDLLAGAAGSAGEQAGQALAWSTWLMRRAVVVVSVGALLMAAGWWFPPVLLLACLPRIAASARLADRQRRQRLDQAADRRLLGTLDDLLAGEAGAAEVRLYGLADHLLQRWRGLLGRLAGETIRFQAGLSARALAYQTLGQAVLLGALLVLGLAVARGQITPAHCIALVVGLLAFVAAATNAGADARHVRTALLALTDRERIRRLAAADPTPPTDARPREPRPFPRPLRHGIVFEGVTFRYPGAERPVLDQLDLTLAPSECLALVGPNGAGKSTLIRLLLGLHRPSGGRIVVDGVDLAAIDPASRRAALAPVFQDHVRYQFTLADAVGFGSPPPSGPSAPDPARLHRAAAAAGITDLVAALPLGWETPLGRVLDERGTDLSGGQWQAVAIARALYADPAVLVLDEPAAALDARAEAELYARVAGLATGSRTTLLVTHRLGAARLADRIAVLDGGRIVENGTHDWLLGAGGLYAELWAAQAAWYR